MGHPSCGHPIDLHWSLHSCPMDCSPWGCWDVPSPARNPGESHLIPFPCPPSTLGCSVVGGGSPTGSPHGRQSHCNHITQRTSLKSHLQREGSIASSASQGNMQRTPEMGRKQEKEGRALLSLFSGIRASCLVHSCVDGEGGTLALHPCMPCPFFAAPWDVGCVLTTGPLVALQHFFQ